MINKKGSGPIIVAFLGLVLLLVFLFVGFEVKLSGFSFFGENYESDGFIEGISELDVMSFNSVESFENYVEFANRMNILIGLLNEKFGLSIDDFEKTSEAWASVSKKISKYTPLINNYNNLVDSCRIHEEIHSKESYSNAYIKVRSFAFELSILSASFTHQITFLTIGKVFGKLGIGSIANTSPVVAKAVMSSAYWSLKSYGSEEMSGLADNMAKIVNEKLNIDITER